MRRLIVTGASGYLGAALVPRAREAGWEVTGTAFSKPGRRVDVRDAHAISALVADVCPDAIVHTAYRQDGPGAREITVDGAENVARPAARAGARLLHVSTDVVFDGRAGRPYTEEDEPSPVTEYGRAKAEAERRVGRLHASALLVRTSLIYGGPGGPPSKHELGARDRTSTFFTNEIRSSIQVGDLASALLELLELDVTGPLHVAGADAVSRHAFAELIARRPVAAALAPPSRPLNCGLDSSRAQALLHTRLRGAREVLLLGEG